MKEVGWNACGVLIVFREKFFGNEVAFLGKIGLLGSSACETVSAASVANNLGSSRGGNTFW